MSWRLYISLSGFRLFSRVVKSSSGIDTAYSFPLNEYFENHRIGKEEGGGRVHTEMI